MGQPRFATALLLCLATASCSDAPSDLDERIASAADPIVNGSPDTAHQAVVAYLHGSKCSATIIAVDGNNGYALTAGHCIGGSLGNIRQGDNTANGQFDVQYPVVEAVTHPDYGQGSGESQLLDFGMLRFTGASAATPVIPALSAAQDNISQGTQLDMIGYGITESGPTTLRYHMLKGTSQVTDLRLVFDQTSSGMCSGDSGGPCMHNVGQERVAGVNSYTTGSAGCTGSNTDGTAVRVSAVYDTFIMPFINGTPYQPQTCDQCEEAHTVNGACTQHIIDCFDNTACSDYVDCINGCFNQLCVDQCAINHTSGYQLYQQIDACVCDTACLAECADDPLCAPPPPCGFDLPNASCQSCYEQSCCNEGKACAADPYCEKCITAIAPEAGCKDDPGVASFMGCLEDSCPVECNMGSGGSGGSSGEGGDGGAVSEGGAGAATSSGSGGGSDEFIIEQGACGCATPGRRGLNGWAWLFALGAAVCAGRRSRPRRHL